MGKDGKPAGQPAIRKPRRQDGRVKVTLLIPDEVDYLLTVVAARRKTDRSYVAGDILRSGLARYQLPGETGERKAAG
jgi:hypothetical protein